MCAGALISVETDEVGDYEIGYGVRRGLLQGVGQQQLVALIAQHLAKEISSRAVVIDHQDLSDAPHLGGSARGPQF
jgi:hypothetical protein